MSEKNPIIKVAFYKTKEAWWRLSPKKRNEMHNQLLEKYKELGIG